MVLPLDLRRANGGYTGQQKEEFKPRCGAVVKGDGLKAKGNTLKVEEGGSTPNPKHPCWQGGYARKRWKVNPEN